MHWLKLALLLFLSVLIVAVTTIIITYRYYLSEINKPIMVTEDYIAFTIDPGLGVEEVSAMFVDMDYISRPEILKAYMFLNSDKVIQAGDYRIPTDGLNLISLVDELQIGSFEKRLTFIEGWRLEEYEDYLIAKIGEDFAADFVASDFTVEGYMFPDTYVIESGYEPENLASWMRNTFTSRTENIGLVSRDDIILASIVEREMNIKKDRPIVAGILKKRLEAGWPLQADATIQYAKGNESDWWPIVTRDDYRGFNSPYNTYLNRGLPPGPICNPSLASIEAVVNSVETEYWFYITDSDGITRYAETLEEHNANVARYL